MELTYSSAGKKKCQHNASPLGGCYTDSMVQRVIMRGMSRGAGFHPFSVLAPSMENKQYIIP